MTNAVEYAMMAGRVYQSTRATINYLPDLQSQGWSEFFHVAGPANPVFPATSGFEAISFVKGNEIVISFAGTFPPDGSGDWLGNLGLGTGLGSIQLLQAADYYLRIKAGNPSATITFTGHSLGGGLASLMAIFFNEAAVTFDQAPFRNAANASVAQMIYTKLTSLYPVASYPSASAWLDPLNRFVMSFDPLGLGWSQDGLATREAKVSNINVQGEFLTVQPFLSRIGNQQTTLDHGTADLELAAQLHSQALMVALLQSDQSKLNGVIPSSLRDVSFKLPDLFRLIFDGNLYGFPTDKPDENFIERLVRHQNGVAGLTASELTLPADGMLTRFTQDMIKLAQNGGMTINDSDWLHPGQNFVSKTLMAFAMQMYYEDTTNAVNPNKRLFGDVNGGVQFDVADVSKTFLSALQEGEKLNLSDAKGFDLYFKNYLAQSTFTESERQLILSVLPYMRDWYVQAGTSGLATTDILNRGAFMLGGSGIDALVGGSASDLLVGNFGDDVLVGGAGNDTLIGGLGNDTYAFQSGDGLDTILDSDGKGNILYDGDALTGGVQYGDNRVYKSSDNKHLYVLVNDSTLIIDGQVVVEGYNKERSDLGIVYSDAPVVNNPITTRDIKGDLKPTDTNPALEGDQYSNDDLGNIITGSVAEPDRADTLRDSVGNDHITSGGGDDIVYTARGGSNFVETGSGRDWVFGGAGVDVVAGGVDGDVMQGGLGDDRLYADGVVTIAAAIVNGNTQSGSGQRGDWLAGNSGDDVLVGSTGNDALFGGGGSDLLIGGAGNDDIMGDVDWVPTSLNWSAANNEFIPAIGTDHPADYGADVIYAGAGNDEVWGGRGNDVLYGEADDDKLFGNGDNDILFGGAGSDILIGDGIEVVGDTETNMGDDYLDGGADDDILIGGAGNDILIGGTGSDILNGGAGQDVYIFNKGDGVDTVNDTKADNNIFRFGAGIGAGDIKLRLGSLLLDLGDSDQIHIKNFDRDDVYNSVAIDSFQFFDGSTLSSGELLARGFDLDGTEQRDEIVGTNITDRIRGFGGDDLIFGRAGDDSLSGGDGDDQLVGDDVASALNGQFHGSDLIDGEGGDDTILGNGGADTLNGGTGNDQIWGDGGSPIGDVNYLDAQYHGNDTINAGDGDDYAEGDGGDDIILGGAGADELWGDAATLSLSGEFHGADYLDGEAGDDTITGGGGADVLFGGSGNDVMRGDGTGRFIEDPDHLLGQYHGNDYLDGEEGDDQMTGGGGADELYGGAGDDVMYGDEMPGRLGEEFEGADYLNGGDGNDQLFGGGGGDTLTGGDGNDSLNGDAGNDHLEGGAGDDILMGGQGNDTLIDIEGNNTFNAGEGNDTLLAGDGNNTLNGDAGDDVITAGNGNNTLSGGDGSDTITAGAGNDSLAGNEGNDILSAGDGNNTLLGGEGNDTLTSGAGIDSLMGGEGNDILNAGAGDDVLYADKGKDTLQGGAGMDTYVMGHSTGQATVIDSSEEGSVVQLDGSGLQLDNLIAARRNNDLLVEVRGTDTTLRIKDYYGATQTSWVFKDAEGNERSVQNLIDASKPQWGNLLDSLVQQAKLSARADIDKEHADAGNYTREADGSWRIAGQSSFLFSNALFEEVLHTTRDRFSVYDENLLLGSEEFFETQSQGWTHNNWMTGPYQTSYAATVGFGDQAQLVSGNYVVLDPLSVNEYYQQGWSQVNWSNGSNHEEAGAWSQHLTYTWTENGVSERRVEQIQFINKTISYAGVGSALTFTDPGGAALVGHTPDYIGVTYAQTFKTYNLGETLLSDGDHVVQANSRSIVIGGVGNNEIYGAALAYGGTGYARLVGGGTLIAGTGEQYLENGKTMVVGDGHTTVVGHAPGRLYRDESYRWVYDQPDTSILIDPNNTGTDLLVSDDSSWRDKNGDGRNDVIEAIYKGQGAGDARQSYQYGGQYRLYLSEVFEGYFNTVEEALDAYRGLTHAYRPFEESLSYIKPLTQILTTAGSSYGPENWGEPSDYYLTHPLETVVLTANDFTTLQPYLDAGYLPQKTVSFGQGLSLADISFSWGVAVSPVDNKARITLELQWGSDQGLRVMIPRTGDVLNAAVGRFEFFDGTTASLAQLIGMAPAAPSFDVQTIELDAGMGHLAVAAGLAAGIHSVALSTADVVVTRDGLDVLITLPGGDDSLRLTGWYGNAGLNLSALQLYFGDGTVWGAADLRALAGADVTGTESSDVLYGTQGSDVLNGLAGDDSLYGDVGSDVYLFSRGFGHDQIGDYDEAAGNIDTVRFDGTVLAADVKLTRDQSHLYLSINGTQDQLILLDWLTSDAAKVERVEFADGTVWLAADLEAMAEYVVIGSEYDDYLQGTSGNDTLLGMEGNDELHAGEGNDTLGGGAGNDLLYGDTGNDVYLFSRGDGQDAIDDYDETAGNIDTLRFDSTIAVGDIRVTRTLDHLILSIIGTEDQILLGGWFGDSAQTIERIEFADGTVWNPAMLESLIELAPGTEGNDVLYGTESADNINGFDGDDELYGAGGDDTLNGDAGHDNLFGGAGNDTLNGAEGSDLLFGGEGDDVLYGGADGDVYVFSRGDGFDTIIDADPQNGEFDSVRFDESVATADIKVTRELDHLYLSIEGTTDRIQVSNWFADPAQGVAQVEFADGTVWSRADVEARLPMSIVGTEDSDELVGGQGDDLLQGLGGVDSISGDGGDDTLDGGAEHDFLSGGLGNDTLSGGTGNDTLYGDYGNDLYLYSRGDGTDEIWDYDDIEGNIDTLRFDSTIAANDITVMRGYGDMYLYINGTSDRIAIAGWFMEGDPLYDDSRLERIEFADGTVWDGAMLESLIVMAEATEGIDEIYGTEGDDTLIGLGGEYDQLFGAGGNDTLDGGAGVDYLYGGTGNDVYLFGRGSGEDQIEENDETVGNIDTIRFDSSVAVGDITVSLDQAGALSLIINGTDDRIRIAPWFGDAYKIERVEFHDGTVWDVAMIESRITYSGTSGSESVYDSEGNDLIRGFGGDDNVYGEGGADVLEGGEGDDNLYDYGDSNLFNGGAGNDTLRSGDGSDFLMGGAGNDGVMNGPGADVIAFNVGDGQDQLSGYYNDGQDDTVSLGGAGLDYANLVLQKNGNDLVLKVSGSDQLTFSNWYGGTSNQTVLNLQVVAEAMAAFDAGSSDPLLNKKVQAFDFQGLVGAFDAARSATPGLNSWALSNGLTQFHLAGSDSEALGGDLAYQYGANGTLAGIGLGKAQEVLTNAQFGAQAQALHSTASLQEGLIRLG